MEPRAAYLAVREAAATLELAPTTVGTALGYRHRRGESDAARELESVLPACVFLAAKVEEEPRRMRDVLNAFHAARHGGELLRDSREYWRLKEALVLEEQQLLRALGFDTLVETPHRLLFSYLHALRATAAVCELSAALCNDADALVGRGAQADDGDEALRAPNVLAAASIALAAQLLEAALPDAWTRAVDVDDAALERACRTLLDCYR